MTDDTTPEGWQCEHSRLGNESIYRCYDCGTCGQLTDAGFTPVAQSSRLRSLEQRLRDLEGYVQHKPDCWTRTASTFADAEAATCTCGLSTLIDQG
jgi:hypothetical protein